MVPSVQQKNIAAFAESRTFDQGLLSKFMLRWV